MVYRYSYVRMFYHYDDPKATPSPFAEFRIFLLSEKQMSLSEENEIFSEMGGGIEFMEWIFISMMIAILKKKIYWEIRGKELQVIDPDEAILDFKSTGITPYYKEFYRYVRFIKSSKKFREYNERDMRKIELARMKQPKFTIITMDKIKEYMAQGVIWWQMISFIQYKNLKKRLGLS